MNFSEHYFVEGDGTSVRNVAMAAVGGDKVASTRQRMAGPVTGGGQDDEKKKLAPGEEGQGQEEPTTDAPEEETPEEETPEEEKPKAVKELPLPRNSGQYGYMNTKEHVIYNSIVDDVIDSGKFADQIVSTKEFKTPDLQGHKIIFSPVGEDPEKPEHNRTIYVMKNREVKAKKGQEAVQTEPWSSVAYRGKISFVDALRLFFPGSLKKQSTLQDMVNDTQWNQQSPGKVGDPTQFASWNAKMPESQKSFTADSIKQAISDQKDESTSFSEYYEYELMLETWAEDQVGKLFKGIGGGIKTALTRPPVKKLNNPNQLLKWFPQKSTKRVKQGAFDAVNAMCGESFKNWLEVKKEYGVIAQQFIKVRNTYVKKIWDIELRAPDPQKQPEKYEAFKIGFDKIVKEFDIPEETHDFEVQDIRIHETTSGGTISTLTFAIFEKGADDGTEGDADIGGEEVATEAEDMTKDKAPEYIFIVAVDQKGGEFFEKNFGANFKQYLTRYANANASVIKKARAEMNAKHGSLVKDHIGSAKNAFKRSEIKYKDFQKILTNFHKYITGDAGSAKLKSGPTKETRNGNEITSYQTTSNGKVLFVNDGPKTDGRILVTPRALRVFKDSKADAANIGSYKEESNENEK